jgi:hypothetical protein
MRVPKWVKMRITHYEQCFRCLSNSGRWDSGRDQTTVFRLTPGLLGSRPIFHVAGRSLLRSSGRAYRRADCPWRAWRWAALHSAPTVCHCWRLALLPFPRFRSATFGPVHIQEHGVDSPIWSASPHHIADDGLSALVDVDVTCCCPLPRWDYLEATGELGNPDTAANHLLDTIETMIRQASAADSFSPIKPSRPTNDLERNRDCP